MLSIIKNRFARSYLLASSFQNLGANIYNMVFVVYLATIYDSKLLVGLADSIVYLPSVLSIWLGFRADKTRKKSKGLIQFSLLQGFIFLGVAYLVGVRHYVAVVVVALLNVFSDVISSYLNYLIKPIFKNNVTDEELMNTNSAFQVVGLIVILASQPLGVWLLSTTNNNFSLLAVINALTFFLSAFIYWNIRSNLTHQVIFLESKESVREQLKKMYLTAKMVFQKSDSLDFIQMISILLLGNALAVSFSSLMNIQFLAIPVFQFSYAQSIALLGLSQILGGLIGGLTVNYLFKKLNLKIILILQSLVMVLIGLFGIFRFNSVFMLIMLFVLAFLGARFGPIFETVLIRYVPDEQLGQVSAFITFLVTIFIPIASMSFSVLGAYNMTLTWWVFLGLSSIRMLIFFKTGRDY